MKRYLILLAILALMLPAFADVIVGTGTSSQRFPFGFLWGYERSASLYPATEIGATGTITDLRWNVQSVGNTNVPIKIYMTTTTQTTLTASTWATLITGLTPVYEGTRNFSTIGWTNIDITDFNYTGDNLLVLVETNYGGNGGSGYPNIYYSSATGMHQQWTADNNPPTGNGTVNASRPNITLVGITQTTPPLATTPIAPANNATLVNTSVALNWNIVNGADGYKVYFGTNPTPAFVADVGANTTYSPAGLLNNTTYYWQIVPYNTYGDATGCPVWSFTTVPAGIVTIGTGNVNNMIPVYPFYGYNYSQSIFLQSEINMPNQRIEKIYYYWNGAGVGTNTSDWVVYMGHTERSTFASATDWVPLSQLTQVYAGNLGLTAAAGWKEIVLTNPFVYNNTQNLVIAVDENTPSYDGSSQFFFSTVTTGQNRSIRYYNDSTNPDPAAPPTGTLVAAYPNIMMQFGDLPANPIFTYAPTSINFGSVMNATTSVPQNVMVSNTGAGVINLTTADISFIGPNANEFSYGTANLPAALGPGQNVAIPVSVTATTEGPISATLRIAWGGNNYDVALTANGLPAGLIIIGTGTETSRFPLGSYYGYERSAALYTAAEIGSGNKRISSLGWYATQAATDNVPTKIYLKSYAGNTISSANWATLITGATPVFDATVNGVTANDWNMFTLANTFDLDSGNNLLVLVERNYGGGGGSAGSVAPAIRSTTISNMHHTILRDSTPPDDSNTSSSQTTRPNIMILATSYELTDPPNPAIAVSPANGATNVSLNAQLNWASGGGAPTGYKLYFGNSNPPAFIGDMGDVTTYNPGALTYSATYYWQVIPYNASGDATGCPIWSFTVMPDPTIILPWEMDFTGVASGTMPANWTRSHSNWSVQNGSNAGGASPELTFSWSPQTIGQMRAITPPLFGSNEAGYELEFKHNVSHYATSYTLKVEYSLDLNTWQTLWSLYPTESVPSTTVNAILPGSLINNTFYLAWTLDGDSYDINNWYVDDISISAIMSAPPAQPILTYPANGAVGLPIAGFNLTWAPDITNGGMPDYYAVFMAHNEDDIYGEEYFETTNTSFNPVSEGGLSFQHNERWFWAVAAVNIHGEEVSDIYRFDIIAAPPQIAVNPSSISEELEVGDTSIQPLYITNDGELPLNYSIRFAEVNTGIRGNYIPQIQEIQPNPNAALYAESAPYAENSISGSRAYLDLQFIYPDADGSGEYGVASDGNFIYTSKWNGSGSQRFFKYSLAGEYLGFFDIDGFSGVRDFTFDGQYFYGATNSTTVYVMDFATQSLVRTISVPVAARGIAYDADREGLWITNNFSGPLRLVNMNGVEMINLPITAASLTGLTYDAISGAGTLWANTQTGPSRNNLVQISPETGSTLSSIEVTSALLPGMDDANDLGGGIHITTGLVPGYASIIANVQNKMMYGFELCPVATWAIPVPQSGVVTAGATATIDVHFDSAGMPAGLYEGMLTITHNAAGAAVEVPVSLTITGEWAPVFNIDEAQWDFGTAELMNPIRKEFTIRNTGGPSLELAANSFSITGDAEGNFSLELLNLPVQLDYNATYKFNAIFAPQSLGNKTATLNIQDGIGRTVHQIPLSGNCVAEPIGSIVNLEATVENITNVRLNWGLASGLAGEPGWIHYDNGINDDGIGTGGVANFDVAVKFSSADLYGYVGMQLEKIKFFPKSGNTDYALKIWTGTDYSLAPQNLVYTQDLTGVIPEQWNEIVLNTPFQILENQAIWFGYNCDVLAGGTQNHPAGCDSGPAVVGKGDLIALGGTWVSMATQYGLSYNWNLQAYVNDGIAITGTGHWQNTPVVSRGLDLASINLGTSGNPAPAQRVLRGYNVFRNGTQINTALVPAATYLDSGLEAGTYIYTVQGVYYSQNTAISAPVEVEIIIPPATPLPYAQDFEAHADNTLPEGWTRSSNGQGWKIGTALSSDYWTIPDHTVYAAANDDAGGSGNDGSEDYLNMPALDFQITGEGASVLLSFDSFFPGSYGQLAFVEVSTNNLDWDVVYAVPTNASWISRNVDLSEYLGNANVFIRFHSDDDGDWASGWAIDNVLVDVVFTDTFPPVITHLPLINTPITNEAYEVIAHVVDDESWNNDITLVQLVYGIDDGDFVTINMELQGENNYVGYIPAQALETQITYFIKATDSENNEAETDEFSFLVQNPVYMYYDLGGSAYVTLNQVYGPAVLFDNPFFDSGTPMQLLAVDGDLYFAEEVTLVIYAVTDNNFTPVYSSVVEFDGIDMCTFDLSEEEVFIESKQFLVAYQGIPADNYFLIDRNAYPYGRSFVIMGGQLYTLSDGAWVIGALVTDVAPEELEAPVVTVALNGDGNPVLSWDAVAGADMYMIQTSADPYATVWLDYEYTIDPTFVYTGDEDTMFFRVIAVSGLSITKRVVAQSAPINLSGEVFSGMREMKVNVTPKERK